MKWRCFYLKNVLSSLTEVRGILFTCVSLGPHTLHIFACGKNGLGNVGARYRISLFVSTLPGRITVFPVLWAPKPLGKERSSGGAHRCALLVPFHLSSGRPHGAFLSPPEAYLRSAKSSRCRPQPPALTAEPRPARWVRGRGAGAR